MLSQRANSDLDVGNRTDYLTVAATLAILDILVEPVTQTTNRAALAGVLVVIAMSTIGLVDNFVVLIAETTSVWQFHAIRSILVLTGIVIFAKVSGTSLKPINPSGVILRSTLAGFSMILYFGALSIVPISQAGAGLFTAPIFVLVFSTIFFGVRIGFWRILAVAVGFTGVLLILRPNGADVGLFTAMPVLAGLCYGMMGLTTRHFCADENTLTLVLGFFLSLLVLGAIGLTYFTLFPTTGPGSFFTRGLSWPDNTFIWVVAAQGIISVFAVGLITRAYQIADASYVAVFEYSFVLSAGFWAWILYSEVPDAIAIIGILAIVAGGLIIVVRTR
jgi:drug/metabolite transporter (DMT)-like permease